MPPKKRRREKNRNTDRLILVGALVLAILLGIIARNYFNNHFIRYGKPGILIPKNYSVHGIDISNHQGKIAWKGVSKMIHEDIRIRFVFMKATEGVSFADAGFERNWQHAGREGIPRGAYHYYKPGLNVNQQVKNFSRKVKLKKGDLPPVLDVEERGNLPLDVFQKSVLTWLREVERIYGVKPIVYTNASFYKDYLQDVLADYPLWVAHYTIGIAPAIARNWQFWQLSDRSNIDGISTFVDFNVFNGDTAAFNRLRVGY